MNGQGQWAGKAFLGLLLMLCGMAAMPAVAQSQGAGLASLTVHVADLDAKGGILRLGLYDAARYPDDKSDPIAFADVPVKGRSMVVTLQGVAPGAYAIQVYQDVNGNDKMDTTWFGYPLEPFGFSRDAKPHLHKPRFGDVSFILAPGENSQTVHLQHSVSLIAAE
jgi:uncharacterized protein (DUF2141 family)